MSIAQRIYLLAGIALAGTILVTAISWINGNRLVASSQTLGHVNLSAVSILSDLTRVYEAQNNVLSRTPAQLDLGVIETLAKTCVTNSAQFESFLAQLKKVDSAGVYKMKIAAVEAELPKLKTLSDQIFKLSKEFQQADAVTLLQEKVYPLQDKIRADLVELTQSAIGAAQAQPELIIKQAESSSQLVLAVCVSVILLSVVLIWIFAQKTVVTPILEVVNTLSASFSHTAENVQQIAESSTSLADGATRQASALEQTSASLVQLSGSTRQNTINAEKTNQLVREARDSAEKGVREMESMNSAVSEIKHSSSEISKIIRTIDEIAFQTNILALNAAVEAARAGEAGQGFAVVADEVRSLAQRSASAAKETAAKIESAIQSTNQGSEISLRMTKVLEEIAAKVRNVDTLAAEVTTASQQQQQGIEQINTAMREVDSLTQKTASNADESARVATALGDQASELQNAVAALRDLVKGENSRQLAVVRS